MLNKSNWIAYKIFDDSTSKHFLDYLENKYPPTTQATTFGGDGGENSEVRNTLISWVDTEAEETLINKILTYIKAANRNLYGFEIYSDTIYDLQLSKYPTGGHYKSHWDCNFSKVTSFQRKLSFVLFFNDEYDGGELVISDTNPLGKPETGTLVVFPSIYYHEVTPVINGTRYTLVGWVEGPPWK